MAQQDNSTTDIDTVVASKAGLITDLNSSYISKEQYSHARNAVRNSKNGDLGTLGNEPSNLFCFAASHKIVGTVDLPDDQVLVFSGNGTDSELGIGNIKTCSYKSISNLSCFNFNPDYPITGVARKDFNKNTIVTFTDKFNSIRRVDLGKIDKNTTCDDILLFKKIEQPCITVNKGQVGNVPNGSYSAVIAYIVDNQVFTDWFSITNRIQLNSDTNSNSLEIKIDGLDKEFTNFALGIVGNYIDPVTKGATKVAKIVGIYSTKVKSISVTDFVNSEYRNIPLSDLVIKRSTWQKAGIISSNSNYLIIGDLVGREEENYQLKAMSIKSEYVIEQVPAEYYQSDGEDVSYYGDENYDFYIQGVYTSGEMTDKFHMPGREADNTDRSNVSSADVYEYDTDYIDCTPNKKIERWQVENTAGEMIPYNNEFKCNRRVLGHGKMGYFESTDIYPDNEDMYGKWVNTPIRYHKFPDECKVPRYSVIKGKTYINIKGVRFTDIPKFDNPDIVGYKITRSDRKGGNGTVVARGLMTNMRGYTDSLLNQEVIYSNYGVNDLSPDQFISSTQTSFKNNSEQNFTPLTEYFKDKFSFYSPHTLFEPRYSLGTELKIESEEIADVTGQFEKVYNHPRQKLMNQFAFWISAAVGFIETSLVILGKQTSISTSTNKNTTLLTSGTIAPSIKSTPLGNTDHSITKEFNMNSVEDLISLNIVEYIKDKILARDLSVISIIRSVITLLSSLAIKIPYSILQGIVEADKTFNIINDFTGYTDYVYQYNALASFNESRCVKNGNKRRRLTRPATYIPSDVVSIDDKVFNNYFREKTVYLELNKEISDPITKDNTRKTLSQFNLCNDITRRTESTGSAFYATSKVINPNQYGEVGSANPVSMHSCVLDFDGVLTVSPILYGGDCVITKFQFQKKMQFFNQNLATVNQGTNSGYPDGTEYDYRLYRNIGYPRFWMDSTKYDFSQLLSSNVVNFTRFSRTTSGKHNLDCKKTTDGKSIARIDDAYMYLSNNSVIEFFVECDYNINFREKTDQPFYSKDNTNLSQIFRSDRLSIQEEFKINRVYSDLYTTEIYAPQQRDDFNPANPIPVNQPNSVIYSLPSFNLQQVDNWQYFLPANYFAFRESDFGKLTAIHKLDQDRIIFLFSKSSPYISMGRDFLELEGSGRKITIGDGGLFAQDPREIMPTDNNYAACNSKYAFSNTHTGRYYPSERQGRIINYTEGLDDITRQGISYWCKNYMPVFFYNYFPEYEEIENPINGVGYLTAFDSFNETVYITKRDFSPKKEYISDITYTKEGLLYKGDIVSLRDTRYFNDISWTLSYSPGEKAFISWHDWHPDWIIQTDNHFMSVKDNGVWKHNERFDDFCNFYGAGYPFEIEALSSSGQQVETVRNIEYLLEIYKYKNFGRDRFHILNENFDRLIVSNTEQISPLLNMVHANMNPEENLDYPKINVSNNISFDISFFKEEQKYRVNQFWSSVRDRGEFTNNEIHLFPTDESGYKQVINPLAINIKKPEEERAKFRHYWNKFRLIKTVSGSNKFIWKLLNVKKLVSPR